MAARPPERSGRASWPGTSKADAELHGGADHALPEGAPTTRFPLAENAPNVPLAASAKSPTPRQTGFGISDTSTPSALSAEQLLEKLSAVVAELKREKRETTRAVEGWEVSFKLRANKSHGTGDVSLFSPDADVIRSIVGLKRKLGVRDEPAEAVPARRRPPPTEGLRVTRVTEDGEGDEAEDGVEEEEGRPPQATRRVTRATEAEDGVEEEEEDASTASDDTAIVPVEPASLPLQKDARVMGRFCASRLGPSRTFWYAGLTPTITPTPTLTLTLTLTRYAGVVTAVHADGTCAIRYDDGDDELVVYPQFVRRMTAEEAAEAEAEKEVRERERQEEARRKQEKA